MHIDRIYEKYVSETPTEVVVLADNKHLVLARNRMYNSHIDIKGFLYTDYAEREYKQHAATGTDKEKVRGSANTVLTSEQRASAAKKGWLTRKTRGG